MTDKDVRDFLNKQFLPALLRMKSLVEAESTALEDVHRQKEVLKQTYQLCPPDTFRPGHPLDDFIISQGAYLDYLPNRFRSSGRFDEYCDLLNRAIDNASAAAEFFKEKIEREMQSKAEKLPAHPASSTSKS